MRVLINPQLSVAVTVTTYGVREPGPALLIVITPVEALPLSVPVKPGAVAVRVATLPLSLGATLGVTLMVVAGTTLVAG